ncbi:putative ribonuclease H protein At1g65750 family [Senna tora]|uniref:Putative ribonuclease H protein At1g65750 family n=1 Tax=Senna tora TaxID=362788 RepID=A0A834W3S1_9FABA|nr:putative ribonuclease H protein At1g65750 family [Senna tora]
MTVQYFDDLYRDGMSNHNHYGVDFNFPRIDDFLISGCSKLITIEELKEAVFSMGPFKSPGPDGLCPIFFHSQWDIISKSLASLHNGGLGLRHLKHQNKAFMTKLGWGLVNQQDDLWVRVLRSKYQCGSDVVPNVVKRSNSSRLWKGIANSWHHVRDGLVWRIGDGQQVRFWTDSWLPNGKKLEEYAFHPLSVAEQHKPVSEFIFASGAWAWDKFDSLVPADVCSMINTVMPPSSALPPDKVAWKHSRDGMFTTRSAYHAISRDEDSVTRNFWKWQGMEKIRLFLWLCGHNRILTNEARWRRGLSSCDTCSHCNNESETLLHTLRDCVKVRPIWMWLVHPSHWNIFFGLDRVEWLEHNLFASLGCDNRSWDKVFANACWVIWKLRNADIFCSEDPSSNDPIRYISHLVDSFSSAWNRKGMEWKNAGVRTPHFISWHKPEEGWVKINVDGAWREPSNRATCGGLIRDCYGNLQLGFMRNIGNCNILTAEVWAILSGLEAAWSMGFKKVELETDSLMAIKVLDLSTSSSHPCAAVIHQIRHFLSRDWLVKILHIFLEGNMAADPVAAAAFDSNMKLVTFTDTPLFLRSWLKYDIDGNGYFRSCLA